MAESVLQKCMDIGALPSRPAGATATLALVGAMAPNQCQSLHRPQGLHSYGSESGWVNALPGAGVELAPGLTEAMVRFAARHEYARTVEDVLARRVRLLFLDAGLAASLAPRVARILHDELGRDDVQLREFETLASQYGCVPV
jgi:glycerol-3-phosphate dehydrogenase